MFLPRLPNLPNRTYTYAVLPRDFLQGLFKVYGMDLPTRLTEPNIDDTIPSNIDPSTISYIGEFLSAPLTYSCLTRVVQ